jgi:hypothetical protein
MGCQVKLMVWMISVMALVLPGCDGLISKAEVLTDQIGTSIGQSFGRLLVSSLLSL